MNQDFELLPPILKCDKFDLSLVDRDFFARIVRIFDEIKMEN
jgi:hypothetical protein